MPCSPPHRPAVPVRTPAEHPLRLHSWRLRFHTTGALFQPTPEDADAHLAGVLAAAAEGAGTSEVPDLQELLGSTGGRGCGGVDVCVQVLFSWLMVGRFSSRAVVQGSCRGCCSAAAAAWLVSMLLCCSCFCRRGRLLSSPITLLPRCCSSHPLPQRRGQI